MKKQNNSAFIDGANLHKGIAELHWDLDYKKFRVWLLEKYQVNKAYLFLGFVPKYKKLYTYLQEAGFILIYKEVTYNGTGKTKGNCDATLVLKVVVDFYEKRYDKAVIVSSDGDYAELVDFLREKQSLNAHFSKQKMFFLVAKVKCAIALFRHQENKTIQIKEKAPSTDRTVKGSLSW